MFEFIEGTLVEKNPTHAVIAAGGIGYRIQIPISTYSSLPNASGPVKLFLSQIVREDAHTLYGFFVKEERDLFETLITISGIGPKTAANMIGHMERASFERAIQSADIKLLSRLPGIGKKTAERLVIEMRDKLKTKSIPSLPTSEGGVMSDALSALVNLGYGLSEAQKAVQKVLQENKELTDLGKVLTKALQKI